MSEREQDPFASAGRPMNTGEFRAMPDVSASTAQFRAFADGREPDPAASWDAPAKRRNTGRLALIAILAVVVIVIIAFLVIR
jgi:hypothetical protein